MNIKNEDYVKVLNSHQQKLIELVKQCITIFSGEDFNEKNKIINLLFNELDFFIALLPSENSPTWMNILRKKAGNFTTTVNKKDNFSDFLNSLMEYYHDIKNQEWVNEEICFEDIYKRNRDLSSLTNLFEELIESISKMISSDELEDETIIAGLNKLINIINANKGKSLYSDLSIIDYIFIFLKNLAVNTLKELPGLKVIIESIEKTMNEIKQEVNTIQYQSLKQIENNTKIELKLIPNNRACKKFCVNGYTAQRSKYGYPEGSA